jgi:cytochrome c oxidase subunit 1
MQSTREFATFSLLVMFAFQLVFFFNVWKSLRSGKAAGRNPWNANTLEWTTESPPGHGNWPVEELPTVYRGAYEYSHPDRELDYWPQNEPK